MEAHAKELFGRKKYSEAVKCFDELLCNPKLAANEAISLLKNRLECNLELRQPEKVVEDARRILEMPQDKEQDENLEVNVKKCLVESLLQLQRFAEAETLVKDWIETQKIDENTKQDFEKILEDFKLKNSSNPEVISINNNLESSSKKISCVYCGLFFHDKLKLRDHCQTEEHQRVIMSDEGREWRHRAPPRGLKSDSYALCENFKENAICSYGNQCVEAHGDDELMEWKERFEYRMMKLKRAQEKELDGKSYTEELVENWMDSPNPEEIIKDKLEYVTENIYGDLNTSISSKNSKKEWKFTFETDKTLCAVALLDDTYRNHFEISKIVEIIHENNYKKGELEKSEKSALIAQENNKKLSKKLQKAAKNVKAEETFVKCKGFLSRNIQVKNKQEWVRKFTIEEPVKNENEGAILKNKKGAQKNVKTDEKTTENNIKTNKNTKKKDGVVKTKEGDTKTNENDKQKINKTIIKTSDVDLETNESETNENEIEENETKENKNESKQKETKTMESNNKMTVKEPANEYLNKLEGKTDENDPKTNELDLKTKQTNKRTHKGDKKTNEFLTKAEIDLKTSKLIEKTNKFMEKTNRYIEKCNRMVENTHKLTENRNKLIEKSKIDLKTIELIEQPYEIDLRTVAHQLKTIENKIKTTEENQIRTIENQLKTNDRQIKTEENEIKTGENQLQTDENQMKTDESQIKTDENLIKTIESQLKTVKNNIKTIENQMKTEEHKTKACENKTKGSENKTKTTQNKTKTVEMDGIPRPTLTKTIKVDLKTNSISNKSEIESIEPIIEIDIKGNELLEKTGQSELKKIEFIEPLYVLDISNVINKKKIEKPKNSYEITVNFKTEIFGTFRQTIIFDFGQLPVLSKQICVEFIPKEDLERSNEIKNHLVVSKNRWTQSNCKINYYEEIAKEINLKENWSKMLENLYPIPNSGNFQISHSTIHEKKLTKTNYKHKLHELLFLEEIQRYELISKYNVNTTLKLTNSYLFSPNETSWSTAKYSKENELFAFLNLDKNLSEDNADGKLILNSCQSVFLLPIRSTGVIDKSSLVVYEAVIEDKAKSAIYLKLPKKLVLDFQLKSDDFLKVQIQFQLNRIPFCEWHYAIDKMNDLNIIFPEINIEPNVPWSPVKQWNDKYDPRLNVKQREAIVAITTPLGVKLPPVLILGPFGTGKTFTLAQAIQQLCKHQENKILICTHSNSAADLYIKEYLHPQVKNGYEECRPLRIYYEKRWVNTVSKVVQQYCLIETDGTTSKFIMPTLAQLEKAKIVILTLSISIHLTSLKVPKGFFTHIFIDEAAQALETQSICPLILANEQTRIILAGDHMQLTPEIFSEFCLEHNLQISLLERLFDYYPAGFPCKILLGDNYRAHEAIIKYMSESFYQEKLICKSKQPRHDFYYPLTFFTTKGDDKQDLNSTGYYNNAEVYEIIDRVGDLIKKWPTEKFGKITENSIGILCFYADQVVRLRSELRKKRLFHVNVERVHNVQGKQFRVIFISTVRTRRTCLLQKNTNELDFGFLSNSKLLNTALTRAQSLVCIVGDPLTLCSIGKCCKLFEKLLEICHENNSLFGDTWESIKTQLNTLEMKKTFTLNPLAPEFIPRSVQIENFLRNNFLMQQQQNYPFFPPKFLNFKLPVVGENVNFPPCFPPVNQPPLDGSRGFARDFSDVRFAKFLPENGFVANKGVFDVARPVVAPPGVVYDSSRVGGANLVGNRAVNDNARLLNDNTRLLSDNVRLLNDSTRVFGDPRLVNDNSRFLNDSRMLNNDSRMLNDPRLITDSRLINDPRLTNDSRLIINDSSKLIINDSSKLVINDSGKLINDSRLLNESSKLMNDSRLLNDPRLLNDTTRLLNDNVRLLNDNVRLVNDNNSRVINANLKFANSTIENSKVFVDNSIFSDSRGFSDCSFGNVSNLNSVGNLGNVTNLNTVGNLSNVTNLGNVANLNHISNLSNVANATNLSNINNLSNVSTNASNVSNFSKIPNAFSSISSNLNNVSNFGNFPNNFVNASGNLSNVPNSFNNVNSNLNNVPNSFNNSSFSNVPNSFINASNSFTNVPSNLVNVPSNLVNVSSNFGSPNNFVNGPNNLNNVINPISNLPNVSNNVPTNNSSNISSSNLTTNVSRVHINDSPRVFTENPRIYSPSRPANIHESTNKVNTNQIAINANTANLNKLYAGNLKSESGGSFVTSPTPHPYMQNNTQNPQNILSNIQIGQNAQNIPNNAQIIQNNPQNIQNSPQIIQNSPQIIQNNPQIMQNNALSIQSNPQISQNNLQIGQNQQSNVQNTQNILNNPLNFQNSPHLIQNSPQFIQNNPQMIQNNPLFVQNNAQLLQNGPLLYQIDNFTGQLLYYKPPLQQMLQNRSPFVQNVEVPAFSPLPMPPTHGFSPKPLADVGYAVAQPPRCFSNPEIGQNKVESGGNLNFPPNVNADSNCSLSDLISLLPEGMSLAEMISKPPSFHDQWSNYLCKSKGVEAAKKFVFLMQTSTKKVLPTHAAMSPEFPSPTNQYNPPQTPLYQRQCNTNPFGEKEPNALPTASKQNPPIRDDIQRQWQRQINDQFANLNIANGETVDDLYQMSYAAVLRSSKNEEKSSTNVNNAENTSSRLYKYFP